MAIDFVPTSWRGIERDFSSIGLSNVKMRTGYLIAVEMDYRDYPGDQRPWLYPNNYIFYSTIRSDLESIFPLSFTITINGSAQSYRTFYATSIQYDGSLYYFSYDARDIYSAHFQMPNDGQPMQIGVSVQARYTTASMATVSFTENACSYYHNLFADSVSSSTVYTGAIANGAFKRSVRAGTSGTARYTSEGTFYCRPGSGKLYVNGEPMESRTSSFISFSFIPWKNPDSSPELQPYTGSIEFYSYYYSDDFYTGKICISYDSVDITIQERNEVDSALLPTITRMNVTADQAVRYNNQIYYIKDISNISATITASFQYGAAKKSVTGYDDFGGNSSAQTVAEYTYTAKPTEAGGSSTYKHIYMSVTDMRGGTASLTASVYVLDYAVPAPSAFAVHRCKPYESGDTRTVYTDANDSTRYTADENGAYCAIEICPEITSLFNSNAKSVTLRFQVFQGGTRYTSGEYTYTPGAYTGETKCIVIDAPTENSFNVTATLTDSYSSVMYTIPLSTAGVLMDYLAGGKGIAFGKVAETSNLVDISPDWDVRAFKVLIGGYNSGQAQDLMSWMRDIEQRISALQQS